MPRAIPAPNIRVKLEQLSQESFSSFGTVVQNPEHTSDLTSDRASSGSKTQARLKVVEANQGSARKYIDVSHLTNHYGSGPSGKPAKAVVNMFVCKPRGLRASRAGDDGDISTDQVSAAAAEQVFDVGILERHPFTPQTFVPMGLARADSRTKYLVIVAPTLPAAPDANGGKNDAQLSRSRGLLPGLWSPSSSSPSSRELELDSAAPRPKGPGLPDLRRLRAFLADGSQAVTYGPGTWHAPMVVIGESAIDFVVFQYANGVADEDCQEVVLQCKDGEGIAVVVVEAIPQRPKPPKAKL